MTESDSTVEFGYARLKQDDIGYMTRKALVERTEDCLKRPVHHGWNKAAVTLLPEALEHAVSDVHATNYELTELAAVKGLFTGGADNLLDNKI